MCITTIERTVHKNSNVYVILNNEVQYLINLENWSLKIFS